MYDGTAGQCYLRAGFYNPVVGRFLQEDTYRGDGLNLYAYCANNPVMYYDPSGYARLCPGGKTNPGNNDLRVRDDGVSTMTRHRGDHSPYNRAILKKLDQMDLSLSVPELEAEVYKLQQASRSMLENGVPIYPIDNEPRIRRLKNASNKIFGVKRGIRTENLIERWMNRYGG